MLLPFQTQGLKHNRRISNSGDCRGVFCWLICWDLVGGFFLDVIFNYSRVICLEPGVRAEAERDYQKDGKDSTQGESLNKSVLSCGRWT